MFLFHEHRLGSSDNKAMRHSYSLIGPQSPRSCSVRQAAPKSLTKRKDSLKVYGIPGRGLLSPGLTFRSRTALLNAVESSARKFASPWNR
jgi:hypothetical protein